eukprot:4801567-Pyramimonas_sp.AAC.1
MRLSVLLCTIVLDHLIGGCWMIAAPVAPPDQVLEGLSDRSTHVKPLNMLACLRSADVALQEHLKTVPNQPHSALIPEHLNWTPPDFTVAKV